MMRTGKKVLCAMCALLTLASAGVSVSAYSPALYDLSGTRMISPRYTNTNSIAGSLTIQNGVAYIGGKIIPKNTMHTEVICRLQKRESDGSWTTLTTCSGSSDSRAGAVTTSSYYVDRGFYYRVNVTGFADWEESSYTSQPKYYA